MTNEQFYREEMVRLGRLLHQRGYVAATDGNLSARLSDGTILVTPTGMSKGMMQPEDMVLVDTNGCKLAGHRQVSTEIEMHLLIYRLRPGINGIVHAHPTTATGFAAAGIALNKALVSEVVLELRCIPLARYATPGTNELCEALAPLVVGHDAILMANHGVVTYGDSILKAYMRMETVEHFAKIALVTHLLGHQQPLSDDDVEKLVATARDRELS
jgi:L-fuculose-phosphate aldolase